MVYDKGGKLQPKIWWSSETTELWTKNQLAEDLGRGMLSPTATLILDKVQNYYANSEKETQHGS